MSIQSFRDYIVAEIEKVFANEANKLLNEARQRTGSESYVAGRMDGLSDSVLQIQEGYNLFVKSEEEANDDTKALY